MDGRMDGWMGGWVDGWMGGWVDGWMDGQIGRQVDWYADRIIQVYIYIDYLQTGTSTEVDIRVIWLPQKYEYDVVVPKWMTSGRTVHDHKLLALSMIGFFNREGEGKQRPATQSF